MLNQYLGEKGGLGAKQGPNELNASKMQGLELQSRLRFQREANVRTQNFRQNKCKVFFLVSRPRALSFLRSSQFTLSVQTCY